MAEPQQDSPLWWLHRLEPKLRDRQVQMSTWDRYYTGDHPLPIVRDKLRQDFLRMLQMSRSNFCEVVIDAVEERLDVEGFRVSASADAEVDERAWEIWQANDLDAESQIAHVEALVKSICPVSVWRTKADAYPRIVIEDPMEMIVAYAPGSRRYRSAALKVFKDEWTGGRRADVWLPDAIWSFRQREGSSEWVEHPDVESSRNPNPLGVVPVVEIRNRPRVNGATSSDLRQVIPSQDRINKLLFDLMLASELASFRQRWVTGLDIPVDEETKQPLEPFKAAIDRLWVSENPDSKFGDFDPTPLEPYIASIEQAVLHIAVQTRTPRHYLIEQGQSPSGDAIKSAETGLVKKVTRKQRFFGEDWEEVMRIARRFDGAADAAVDAEIVWADPESRGEGELVDAAVKKNQLGVPWRQVMEDLGYSQTQIARFSAMRMQDALREFMQRPQPEEPEPEPEAA